MKNLGLPHDLQAEVRDFLIFTQSTHDQQEEMERFLNMISPSLKKKIAEFIFSDMARQNPILHLLIKQKMDEYIAEAPLMGTPISPSLLDKRSKLLVKKLVSNMTTSLFNPEDVIIKQNET